MCDPGGVTRRRWRFRPTSRRSTTLTPRSRAVSTAGAAVVLALLVTSSGSRAAEQIGATTGADVTADAASEVGTDGGAGPGQAASADPPEDGGGTTGAANAADAGGAVVAEARGATVTVFAGPDEGAAVVRTLDNPTAAGGPLVFHVVADRPGWLQVDLPLRPNGTTGWIRAGEVALARTTWRVEVRLAERTLAAYDGDELVLLEPIGVGRHPTPTPGGTFYLYELLEPPDPNGPYGPYAFGLSGFSEALTSFAGGDGRLGIHGTNDPASIGNDSTAGCIRLPNAAITQLARTLPLGTPVQILP